MPTITASTMTLMPDDTTLPSTRSARKLVRFHSENGTRMKPASEVSLNSIIVTNICPARMTKVLITTAQANSSTEIDRKLTKKVVNPISCGTLSSSCHADEDRKTIRCGKTVDMPGRLGGGR